MSIKGIIKKVKELGWDKIILSESQGFAGAVKGYQTEKGQLGVLFSLNGCFVVSDENGYFSSFDIYKYVMKPFSDYMEDPSEIDGVETVAYVNDNEVIFLQDVVDYFNFSDEDLDDMKKRLLLMSDLDEKEMELGF